MSSVVINDLVAGYVAYLKQNTPNADIKKALLHFTKDEVHQSKVAIWNAAEPLHALEKFIHRQDSATRSGKDAECDDIISAVEKLLALEDPPNFTISAFSLHRIPKHFPGELMEPSVVERLSVLETQFNSLMSSQTETAEAVAKLARENSRRNMQLKQNSSSVEQSVIQLSTNTQTPSSDDDVTYAKIAAQSLSAPTPNSAIKSSDISSNSASNSSLHVVAPTITPSVQSQPDASLSANPPGVSPSAEGPSIARHVSPKTQLCAASSRREDDGFEVPNYLLRRERRREKREEQKQVLTGNGAPHHKLTAANRNAGQHPRMKDCQHLFIFNVDKDVPTDAISELVNDAGLSYVALKCVSHENARSKSFKLSLTPEVYDRIYKREFWPEGIAVKRFHNRPYNQRR